VEILAEPARTRFDLRFAVLGIPVRVHPMFWIGTLLLSLQPGSTVLSIAIWLPAVFLSILVHELGHVLAFRRYGRRSRITVYGMGGLAIADDGGRGLASGQQIFVSAAGPLAGFVLGGIVVAVVAGLGYRVDVLGFALLDGATIESLPLRLLVNDLLAINFLWGLVNLAPVVPLDGSTIAYHAFFRRDAAHGRENSARTSFLVAVVLALIGLFLGQTLMAILFAVLAFSSYQVLGQLHADPFKLPSFKRSGLERKKKKIEHELRLIEGGKDKDDGSDLPN